VIVALFTKCISLTYWSNDKWASLVALFCYLIVNIFVLFCVN